MAVEMFLLVANGKEEVTGDREVDEGLAMGDFLPPVMLLVRSAPATTPLV
jgi:hypothetical protein